MTDPIRLKRLHYRSCHRGCKETDLALGRFAEEKLQALPLALIELYERFLEENDADIWQWLTGKDAPQEYEPIMKLLGARD